MLFKYVNWAALLLLGFLCLTACEKDPVEMESSAVIYPELPTLDQLTSTLTDPETINFFDIHYVAANNPHVTGEGWDELPDEIADVYFDYLYKNHQTEFVTGLIDRIGYPIWSEARVLTTPFSEEMVVALPFSQLNDDSTRAVIVAITDASDPYYAGHDRDGYLYLNYDRLSMRQQLPTIATDETGNTLFSLFLHIHFDNLVFDLQDPYLIAIFEEHDDGFVEGGEIVERDWCTTIIEDCPQVFTGEIDDRSCITVTITYECEGFNGGEGSTGGTPNVPGGITNPGNSDGRVFGGGINLGISAGDVALQNIFAQCAGLLEPDVEFSGPITVTADDCTQLAAAIDNLGYDALPSDLWVALVNFNGHQDLLATAGGIDPMFTDAFIDYANYILSTNADLKFRDYVNRINAVETVTQQLGLSSGESDWLLSDALGVESSEESVVSELVDLLASDPDLITNNYEILSTHSLYQETSYLLNILVEFSSQEISLSWNFDSNTTVPELIQQIDKTNFIQDVYGSDQIPKVYFNLYGYNGATELMEVDGELRWVHHHWSYPMDMEVYYVYDEAYNQWFPFDPNEDQNNQMSFLAALADAFIDAGHSTLDLVGLVPVVGEIADGVNAIWYIAEGDWGNGLIAAAAMVPVVGNGPTLGKYIRNSLTLIKEGGQSFFVSRKGLKYVSKTGGDRLGHVFHHVVDDLDKSLHGVFDDPQDVVGIVDEAYGKVLNNSSDVISSTPGISGSGEPVTVIIVDLNRRIGWQGGWNGSGGALQQLKLVLKEGTTQVVSAYPF